MNTLTRHRGRRQGGIVTVGIGLAFALSQVSCARRPTPTPVGGGPPAQVSGGEPVARTSVPDTLSVAPPVRRIEGCGPDAVYGEYFPEASLSYGAGSELWKRFLYRDLLRWSEPAIWDCGRPGRDSVRVLPHWGGLTSPDVVRIERVNGKLTAYSKRFYSHETFSGTGVVSDADWTSVVECLVHTSFWTDTSRPVEDGADGNIVVLEASVGRRYNVLRHTSFSVGAAPASFDCIRLISLAAETVTRETETRLLKSQCEAQRLKGIPVVASQFDPCALPTTTVAPSPGHGSGGSQLGAVLVHRVARKWKPVRLARPRFHQSRSAALASGNAYASGTPSSPSADAAPCYGRPHHSEV